MTFTQRIAEIVSVIYPSIQQTKAEIDALDVPALSQAAGSAIADSKTATNKATIATTKASEASASASNAHTSETNAASSAQTATDKATIATTKASEAANARNAAIQSAADAQTIKDSIWNIHVPMGWVSGSSYAKTKLIIDPTTLLTYIANKDITNSTIEPHLDDANFDLYTINTVDINGNAIHVRLKCGTIAQLTGVILQLGEMAYVIDNGNIKAGDGITTFLSLGYLGENTPLFQALKTSFDSHTANKNNPHEVTKSQVGLDNVDNTSDLNKPVSTAVLQLFTLLKDGSSRTIKDLENSISSINTVLSSNDINLDTLQELVNYIKSEQTLLDSLTIAKVSVVDIVNTLTSTVSNKPLSALQGKILCDSIRRAKAYQILN